MMTAIFARELASCARTDTESVPTAARVCGLIRDAWAYAVGRMVRPDRGRAPRSCRRADRPAVGVMKNFSDGFRRRRRVVGSGPIATRRA